MISRQEVTSTVPHALPYQSSTETRITAYDYYTDTGRLKTETIEPDASSTNKSFTQSYTYNGDNSKGQLSTTTVSGADIVSRTSIITYDTKSRVSTRTNSEDHTETFAYLDSRFPWLATKVTGPNLLDTRWEFDSFGRKEKTIRPDGTSTTAVLYWCANALANCEAGESHAQQILNSGSSEAWAYFDKLGREVRQVTWVYNGAGNSTKKVIAIKQYDAQGRVSYQSEPYFENTTVYGTTILYDDLNRPYHITSPNDSVTSIDYSGGTTVYTNALNQNKTIVKNALGQTVQTLDHYTNSVDFVYDAFGNLVKTTDEEGNEIEIEFDIRGRKVKMDDPDQGLWKYTYDALANLKTQTDANAVVTTFNYDLLNRKTREIQALNGQTKLLSNWEYDIGNKAIGKLNEARTGITQDDWKETYSYDNLGRPEGVTTEIDSNTFQNSTGYDSFSRPRRVVYPTGFAVRMHYDAETGSLTEVRDDADQSNYWTLGKINNRGQILDYTLGSNNIVASKVYWPETGRLRFNYANAYDSQIQNESYLYDSIGNADSINDISNGINDIFAYDDLNRLTDVHTHHGGTIDHVGIGYNALGNIESKSDVGTYSYGGTCNGVTAGPHAITATTGVKNNNYCYDDNGGIMNSGTNATFDNDRIITRTTFSKPSLITKKFSDSTYNQSEFDYDANKSRYKRIDRIGVNGSGSSTTTTVYVGSYEKVTKGSQVTHRFYVGDYAIVTKEEGNAYYDTNYLLRNHLGSVVRELDEIGLVQQNYSYDVWGNRRETNGVPLDDIFSFVAGESLRGFTGHEHLDGVGLIHMNGRVFDPVLARFTSADPFIVSPTNLQGFNRYSYVRNNPLRFVDPSGYFDRPEPVSSPDTPEIDRPEIEEVVVIAERIPELPDLDLDFLDIVDVFGLDIGSTVINGTEYSARIASVSTQIVDGKLTHNTDVVGSRVQPEEIFSELGNDALAAAFEAMSAAASREPAVSGHAQKDFGKQIGDGEWKRSGSLNTRGGPSSLTVDSGSEILLRTRGNNSLGNLSSDASTSGVLRFFESFLGGGGVADNFYFHVEGSQLDQNGRPLPSLFPLPATPHYSTQQYHHFNYGGDSSYRWQIWIPPQPSTHDNSAGSYIQVYTRP